MKTYFKSLLQIIHTLEKSKKLSEDEKRHLEKQVQLLSHLLDTKKIKEAKVQTEKVSGLILEIIKR